MKNVLECIIKYAKKYKTHNNFSIKYKEKIIISYKHFEIFYHKQKKKDSGTSKF